MGSNSIQAGVPAPACGCQSGIGPRSSNPADEFGRDYAEELPVLFFFDSAGAGSNFRTSQVLLWPFEVVRFGYFGTVNVGNADLNSQITFHLTRDTTNDATAFASGQSLFPQIGSGEGIAFCFGGPSVECRVPVEGEGWRIICRYENGQAFAETATAFVVVRPLKPRSE